MASKNIFNEQLSQYKVPSEVLSYQNYGLFYVSTSVQYSYTFRIILQVILCINVCNTKLLYLDNANKLL